MTDMSALKMKICTGLIGLTIAIGVGSIGHSQDPPLTEVQDRFLLDVLEEQLESSNERVALLQEGIELRKELASQVEQLETGDAERDEELREQLESQIWRLEVRLEAVLSQLDLNSEQQRLSELTVELRHEELPELVSDAESLSELLIRRVQLLKDFFRAIETEDEEREHVLEQSTERLSEEYKLRRERLGLKFELHWAV